MRSSETLIEFFNRFEDALRNHVMPHGRERVETGLGQKFIYPQRAFVEDNCWVEDKNKECIAHLRTNHPQRFLKGILSSESRFRHHRVKTETKRSLVLSRINATILSVY
jgi:hypothetical protein